MAGEFRRILLDGARAGVGLAGVWVLVWVCVLAVTPPEPQEFLAWLREHPRAALFSSGMTFDLRACADCPVFLVADRGVGAPGDYVSVLPTLWSWPALRAVSRGRAGDDVVVDVPLGHFALALVVQWFVTGVAIVAAARGVGAAERMWAARRGRRTSG